MIKVSKTRLLKQLLITLLAPGLFLVLVLGYVQATSEVYMVKDINPTDNSWPAKFTNVEGTLYFVADDGIHGFELWKSDGTLTGTMMISDIYPGMMGSAPDQLVEMNGVLYFAADHGTYGREVWKSDGTLTGTTIISDIFSGTGDGFAGETQLVRMGNALYWGGNNGSTGRELWKSDGTATGTMLVKDIEPGNSGFVRRLAVVNDTLFFSGYTGTYGSELWKSDGTMTGTVMVKDINPGTGSSDVSALTNVNGTLFFNATNGSDGYELWKSDGALTGTVMISDINPGAADGVFSTWIFPHPDVNNTAYFVANDGNTGLELWKSDGTMTGTAIVSDINPGINDGTLGAYSLPANLNGLLFFVANDGNRGVELWKSDGTVTGTMIVSDINPGAGSALGGIDFIIEANGAIYFPAYDGTNGNELWKSDGTLTGTIMVTDINPASSHGIPAFAPFGNQAINVNNLLFFEADNGSNGTELWALPLDASPPPPSQSKTYLPVILK